MALIMSEKSMKIKIYLDIFRKKDLTYDYNLIFTNQKNYKRVLAPTRLDGKSGLVGALCFSKNYQKEVSAMRKMENTHTEDKYIESKCIRNMTLDNVDYDFLDKIKVIPYLTNDMVLSIDQVANYYESTIEAVRTIIKRNRGEFESDGMATLRGEELKTFLSEICEVQNEPHKISGKTRNLTLLTKRSLLRVGMILTNSEVATQVRNHLLNIEERTEIDAKSWSIQREVGKIERARMTSAISKYVPDSPHKRFAYPNYTNMVYRTIFNKDAKTIREERGAKDDDSLRDLLSKEELSKVEEVETIITGLVSMQFTYKQIQQMIHDRYIKKLKEA